MSMLYKVLPDAKIANFTKFAFGLFTKFSVSGTTLSTLEAESNPNFGLTCF